MHYGLWHGPQHLLEMAFYHFCPGNLHRIFFQLIGSSRTLNNAQKSPVTLSSITILFTRKNCRVGEFALFNALPFIGANGGGRTHK